MTKWKKLAMRCGGIVLSLNMIFTVPSFGETIQKADTPAKNLIEDVKGEKVSVQKLDKSYKQGVIDFSINLFKENAMKKVENGKNAMVSPESVLLALSMTANGAKGNTLKEMEQVLCNGMDIHDLNVNNYSLMKKQMNSQTSSYHIANSIWFRDDEGFKVGKKFLKEDKTYYNADIYKEPFDESTLHAINAWVDSETDGMIKRIINEIPTDSVMYLLNAITFEGKWADPYEDFQIKKHEKFKSASGKVSKVTMLHSTEGYYMHDDNAQAFIKPYEGGQYGFMAILPNKDITAETYMKNLTGKSFRKLYKSQDNEYEVQAGIPEFSTDYQSIMNDSLMNMGIKQAFTEKANFGKLGQYQDQNLYIGRVVHKTHIDVDRNGTKAAAVTSVEMKCTTVAPTMPKKQKTIILNRPFIYAIVDMKTGIPVFIGIYQTT